jgi:LAO/AO transport system kinase
VSLLTDARGGSHRAVGRLLSAAESGELDEELPSTGARVVGLTGPPGVGKSTTTNALLSVLRRRGATVAVVAVDPSSPFSGGALLGDRIRMQEHATDKGVFIRSMASRGHLGGLAAAAPAAVRVLDACGFDVVLLETVGVGQSEVEIAEAADTAVVVLAPGAGDGIQAAKAGVLEIADVFVVNKSDRDGADATARELRTAIARSPRPWAPPVLSLVAAQGQGVEELADALDAHRSWLERTGGLAARRRGRARAEVEALALGLVRRRLSVSDEVADAVAAGQRSARSAAESALSTSQPRG